jgi:flagellar motor switch/type III secretory pathway protein FliN
VPAPRVFPREPKSLLQANITIDHRSQITEKERKREREKERKRERERERAEKRKPRESVSQSVRVLFAINSRISTQIGRMHMVRPCEGTSLA